MPVLTTFLFDLDGTLLDSLEDLRTGLNHLRAEYHLGPMTREDVRQRVGDGARKLVERSLPQEHFDDATVQRFLALYKQHLLDRSRPYPGITDLLDSLRGQGARLGVVTNKPIALTRPILEGLNLTPYFGTVWGGDSGPTKKPDPGMVQAAMTDLGSTPKETLVIGDHHTDLRAGRAAGARTCFCSWGFGHTDGLAPDFRAHSTGQLHRLLIS